MAKVIWSSNLLEVQKTAGSIAKKDDADADKSVIKPYLAKKKIVPADLKKNMDEVVRQDALRVLLEGEANARLADRDALMVPIVGTLHGWGQRLKNWYSDNLKEVQSWSIVILESGKIVYPSDFLNTEALVKAIIEKHNNYKSPEVSPLDGFNAANNVNVNTILANLALAAAANEQAGVKANAATTATAEKNKLYKPTLKTLKGIGKEITTLYPNDPNKWKEYGLEVVLEPERKQGERTVKVAKGQTVVKSNIVVGSILKNTGDTDLLVEKGGKKKSTPILVKQSEEILIRKGYSKIKVSGTVELKDGAFTVTVHL